MTDDEQPQKRGEATRDALIQAGLELFGEYGFQTTTTRMLCDHAGANISAIPYYFGGKRGLYHAVLHYIVERIQSQKTQNPLALQALLISESRPSREQARGILKQVMLGVSDFFLMSDEPRKWMQIILREQARPTDGFDIVYENHIRHMQAMIARLIGIATGMPPESDEAKLRGHAFFGQVMGFLVAREALLRMLGVRQIGPEHAALIKQTIAAHVEACLAVPPLQESTGKVDP